MFTTVFVVRIQEKEKKLPHCRTKNIEMCRKKESPQIVPDTLQSTYQFADTPLCTSHHTDCMTNLAEQINIKQNVKIYTCDPQPAWLRRGLFYRRIRWCSANVCGCLFICARERFLMEADTSEEAFSGCLDLLRLTLLAAERSGGQPGASILLRFSETLSVLKSLIFSQKKEGEKQRLNSGVNYSLLAQR